MNEERYLELKQFIENYEKRHILDKHPWGNETLKQSKKLVQDYENNTKIRTSKRIQ